MVLMNSFTPAAVMKKMRFEGDDERGRYNYWVGRLGWIVAGVLGLTLLWRFRTTIGEATAVPMSQLEALKEQMLSQLHIGSESWENTQSLFFFGDSYTATGDWQNLPSLPSRDNPILEDGHFTVAPNWVDFLTQVHNRSEYKAYNFAVGGSVVDDTIVKPFLLGTNLRYQINSLFLRKFVSEKPYAQWDSSNTVFCFLMGINDIGMFFNANADGHAPIAQIFHAWSTYIGQLYDGGARNFLFLTLPPFDRATPEGPREDRNEWVRRLNRKIEEMTDISSYNARIYKLRQDLRRNHTDVSAKVFDAHSFYSRILETPEQFPEMDGIVNTTGICSGDNPGTYYNTTCNNGEIKGSYAWSPLHATYRVHNATAARIMEDCFGPAGKKGFCL